MAALCCLLQEENKLAKLDICNRFTEIIYSTELRSAIVNPEKKQGIIFVSISMFCMRLNKGNFFESTWPVSRSLVLVRYA